MLNEDALARALGAAGLSAPVRWDDVTGSTNALALALAAQGTPDWTLVGAGHQTAGRGRLGRIWVDRPGAALLCSVVLRPPWEPDHIGLVPLAAGVAMAEAIGEVSAADIRCKWPNDLLAGGKKIGGVLSESEAWEPGGPVVVGVGVNLEAPDDVPGAGAIGRVDPEALLTAFLRGLRALVEGHQSEIRSRWRAVSDTLGRRIEATTVGGAIARGVAVDLDETGALLVDSTDGPVRVASGEIHHLDVDEG